MINKMENINDVTMEKNYTVYMHVCPNGKRYIGITRNKPNVRWGKDGKGYINNRYFYRAIQKYGWENIVHIVIENNLTKEQAENMEIELIAKFKSNDREYGYNIENGGNSIGKHSDETRKKLSESNKGANNPQAKKIHCDGIIFGCITECGNYYGLNSKTVMMNYLNGRLKMNEDFQKLNLRYATENDLNECEKYDASKHGDKASIVITIRECSKTVHCNGIIFNSIKECANYYNVKVCTMQGWIIGNVKMNEDFQKLNLRIATNDDINKCEKYDASKHGDKASIVITIIKKGEKKAVHCDNLIFNSIRECANYYDINKGTMEKWLKGQNKMRSDFQKLNLRYATNEDLNTYPRYTPVNN